MNDDANPQGIQRPRLATKKVYQDDPKTSRPMIPVRTKSQTGGRPAPTTSLGTMLGAAIGAVISDTATQKNNMALRTGQTSNYALDTSALDNLVVGEGNDPKGTERPRIPVKRNED